MSFHTMQQFSENQKTAAAFLGSQPIINSEIVDDTLLEQFDAHFDMIPANTPERVRTAQKIRYQVYCIEHPHEAPNNPNALECDEFDAHAAHSILQHRATNIALGTVRLVLPIDRDLEHSFPVQRVLDENSTRIFNQLPLHSTAEVSRFSISRQFRRLTDSAINSDDAAVISRSAPLMRLGLIQALVQMSVQHGITHWCAAMEPTLLRMLAAMAIRFQPVGPLVEYHGLRQPCYCDVAEVLEAVRCERPSFWSVLTDGGAFNLRAMIPTIERTFVRELAS